MLHLNPATVLFLFVCAHALGDFALQSEWVATNKDRHARDRLSPSERAKFQVIWPHLLSAHALHHALLVFLITQRLSLGIAEFVVHWVCDFGKCEKWYGFHADQAIHIASKVLWTYLLFKHS